MTHRARLLLLILGRIAVPLLLVLLLWRVTPLAEMLRPGAFRETVQAAGPVGGPAAAIGLFVLLGLVLFPANLLIAGTTAAFGAWPGLAYAVAGALCSASVTYGIGRGFGPKLLRELLGPRTDRIVAGIARNGITAVVLVRITLVAPFSVVNLVAGAIRIRYADFMVGTAIGIIPALTVMTLLGDRLWQVLASPALSDLLVLGGILLLWAGMAWGAQRLARRLRGG